MAVFQFVHGRIQEELVRRTYNKISDVQRSKLQEFYDGGMKTCGSVHIAKIEKAAKETGLTIDQVKVINFFVSTYFVPLHPLFISV